MKQLTNELLRSKKGTNVEDRKQKKERKTIDNDFQ